MLLPPQPPQRRRLVAGGQACSQGVALTLQRSESAGPRAPPGSPAGSQAACVKNCTQNLPLALTIFPLLCMWRQHRRQWGAGVCAPPQRPALFQVCPCLVCEFFFSFNDLCMLILRAEVSLSALTKSTATQSHLQPIPVCSRIRAHTLYPQCHRRLTATCTFWGPAARPFLVHKGMTHNRPGHSPVPGLTPLSLQARQPTQRQRHLQGHSHSFCPSARVVSRGQVALDKSLE
jgi:hypothetical protein